MGLRERWLKTQFGWPRRFPSNATYTRALASCDAEELAHLMAQGILKARASEQHAGESLTQVAVDGKTLRGTLGHRHAHQPAVHVLSWYDPQTGLVLAHRAVEHKRNEISTLASWLSPSLVKDRLITADAMHTQQGFCVDVLWFGGHDVLIAKKHQPPLLRSLPDTFKRAIKRVGNSGSRKRGKKGRHRGEKTGLLQERRGETRRRSFNQAE